MFHSAIAKVEPVEYVFWFNAKANRKASLFGACPWFDGSGEENWERKSEGYTLRVEHKDGSVTYGLGRPPFATIGEAVEFADKINARFSS
jgi:hypothetical protein